MKFSEQFCVKLDTKVNLAGIDPNNTLDYHKKEPAELETANAVAHIAQMQYELYAENKQSLLVVLQAMDAGGKDGTINHVFAALNPQGCRTMSFKVPTANEAAHDFLWRCHNAAPRHGEVVIFNRSHYEDVLITRVHGQVSAAECSKRYKYINHFESLLADNRTRIVKLFLHIDAEEQLKRLTERVQDPEKQWKITLADFEERRFWPDYQQAFEDVFNACNTATAPWFIIPANKKWFRNLAVAKIIEEALMDMQIKLPEPSADLPEVRKLLKL